MPFHRSKSLFLWEDVTVRESACAVPRPVDDVVCIEMYSTISFITDDLIQVYAGNNCVAYTGDDVFVYPPRYWERVVARLEVR